MELIEIPKGECLPRSDSVQRDCIRLAGIGPALRPCAPRPAGYNLHNSRPPSRNGSWYVPGTFFARDIRPRKLERFTYGLPADSGYRKRGADIPVCPGRPAPAGRNACPPVPVRDANENRSRAARSMNGTLGINGGRSPRRECESAPTLARPPEPAGVIRRGLESVASSILQDGAARADDHDGPIAEGRHAVQAADSARGGDDAPARAVPVLEARIRRPRCRWRRWPRSHSG